MRKGQKVQIVVKVNGGATVETGKVVSIHGNSCKVKLDSGRTVTAFCSQVQSGVTK